MLDGRTCELRVGGIAPCGGPLARESLALQMLETSPQPERLAWLAQVVPALEGTGVIYVLTVADTTRVASFLRTQGIDAAAIAGQSLRVRASRGGRASPRSLRGPMRPAPVGGA
jgi:superfamily II DNA helicase RecQ